MSSKITNCNRILIIKLSSIGDVVMASPVAKALRGRFPDSHIAWVVDDKSKDVVVGNPYLDEVIVWKRDSAAGSDLKKAISLPVSLARLAPELRSRKFDVAIDLQGLLRSALVTWMSGATHRLGYDNAREGGVFFYNVRFPARERRIRGPQQYLNMLELLDVFSDDLDMHMPIGEDDRAFARDLIAEATSDSLRGRTAVVALCPATTWRQKHWTGEGWAQLADALVSKHDMLPIFLGSPADVPLINRISGLMKFEAVNMAGKTTLKQAAAMLEQSKLMVAVDTGLLHIALALDRPTIGLFGPTEWRHFAKKDNFAVAAKDFPCMPCFRHPTCKHFDCMKAITSEDILSAASPWLAGQVTTQFPAKEHSVSTPEGPGGRHATPVPETSGTDETSPQLRPLRTLHVETGMHSLGGPAQVVYLMRGLKDRGHEASLVCPKGSSVSRHAMAAGLDVITVPLRTDLDISFVLRLRAIIGRVKPDLVHLHSRRGADIMGGIAARLARVPAVILSRRIDNPIRRWPLSCLKYGPLCDRIIAVSNGVAKALIKGGVDPTKITCVHSVADAKRYQKKGSEDKVRAEFGLDEDTNVIAIIAQLIERKGHRYLLQAAPEILKAFPKTMFLILGEGRLESDLRQLAASSNIQDKVIFAGFRSDIGELLSIVTVLVHPATMEGFANCVLQAMAAEVPAVVTAVGGMPEAVQDGVNGILVPPRDVESLSSAVIQLLGAPEQRRSMGEAGRRIVEEQFDVDGMVEGVLSVYYDALRSDKSVVHAAR